MTVILTMDVPGWEDSLGPNGNKIGDVYREDGFTIRDSFDLFGPRDLVDPSPTFPIGSGPYLSGYRPEVTRDGYAFGAFSVKLDVISAAAGFVITGAKADGSFVSYVAAGDNTPFQSQTIVLPDAFHDKLVSIAFNPIGLGSLQISIDDLLLSPANLITGTTAADIRTGTGGDDELHGYGGNDRLNGGNGADILDGGIGTDTLQGGQGDDLYIVALRDDLVIEGAAGGIDTVATGVSYTLPAFVENLRLRYGGDASGTGNELANQIYGNTGSNLLRGRDGDDLLLGGDGLDTLHGEAGNDILDGGRGADIMTGSWGADLFRFTGQDLGSGAALGTITDFSHKAGDLIALNGLGAQTFIGTAAFTPIDEYGNGGEPGQFGYSVGSGFVTLRGDVDFDGVADWSIILTGVTSLAAGDFVIGA